MIRHGQYTVDGTTVKLSSTNGSPLNVRIHTTQKIFIGNSSAVSSSTGFLMDTGDNLEFLVADNTEIWAISNGATASVYVLESIV